MDEQILAQRYRLFVERWQQLEQVASALSPGYSVRSSLQCPRCGVIGGIALVLRAEGLEAVRRCSCSSLLPGGVDNSLEIAMKFLDVVGLFASYSGIRPVNLSVPSQHQCLVECPCCGRASVCVSETAELGAKVVIQCGCPGPAILNAIGADMRALKENHGND